MSNNSPTPAQKESLGMDITKYPDLISSLPEEYCPGIRGYLYQYQGFWYPLPALEGVIALQQQFQAQKTDIFVCSAPKTGTTWLKALCFAIQTRANYTKQESNSNPLLNTLPHLLIPFIEVDLAAEKPKSRKTLPGGRDLPLFSTHMPYNSLPESILESGTKIIYICRDPKATLTSYAFSSKNFRNNVIDPAGSVNSIAQQQQQHPFQELFLQFCEGKYPGGPYWEHVLGYWKASLEGPDSVLFLKYEGLKDDILLHIRKIAEFMGKPFSVEEEEAGVPQEIANMCSFENLSNLDVNKNGKHRVFGLVEIPNSAYFRKGLADEDWKNHLTREMIQTINQITRQKLIGSDLSFGV